LSPVTLTLRVVLLSSYGEVNNRLAVLSSLDSLGSTVSSGHVVEVKVD
jgi:hypothetical protein